MWSWALERLRCPACRGAVQGEVFAGPAADPQAGPFDPERQRGGSWIHAGALVCQACRTFLPIVDGVPVCLPYTTETMRCAVAAWPGEWRARVAGFGLPGGTVPPGETGTARSFSTEWSAYDYGDTLWTAPTQDRLHTFRTECGLGQDALRDQRFLEIGCGLGITTDHAATWLGAEAWGLDLSDAVFRAASQFRGNRRLHFVQGSVFAPPLPVEEFEFVYSHGVLHHTWSTREAVHGAAELVAPSGSLYVWLYGYEDVRRTLPRRLAYGLEALVRPALSRAPSRISTAALSALVPLYRLASAFGTRSGTHATTYTNQQALHAARDRFTPRYAHRHETGEVEGWLREEGFRAVARIRGDDVAESWRVAFECNVALRAGDKVCAADGSYA